MTYIIYKCKICNKHFILMTNEINHENQGTLLVLTGRHKNIVVVGKHEGIKSVWTMIFKKVSGRTRRR